MSIRLSLLAIAAILFFVAGCGIQTVSMGSVTLHTGWFGLFFLAISKWPSKTP